MMLMLLILLPFIAARAPCRDSREPVYHPSELENEWVGKHNHRIVEGRVCAVAARQLNATSQQGELTAGASRIKAWLNYTHGANARAPTSEERAVLSRLACSDGRTEYLEPLHGIARHPLAKVGCPPAVGVTVFGAVPAAGLALPAGLFVVVGLAAGAFTAAATGCTPHVHSFSRLTM